MYFLQGQQDTPLPPLTDEQLKECVQQIKEYYRTYLCQIQTDPLDSDTILDLEDIFTQLVLQKDDKKDSKVKQKIDYSEFHKIKNLGFPVRRLLVEGEGGAGKTTLCAKIALDWLTGKNFEEFTLVLVIPLRESKTKTVGEIIKTYLYDTNRVEPHQLDAYIHSNTDKVFIILDGFDEIGASLSDPYQLIKIISLEQYKSCLVLVTTRPWKADLVREVPNLKKAYAFIHVEGFDKNNLPTYINKFFKVDIKAANDLILFMADNDVIAENMAPYPIYTAMLCIMWREYDEEKREGMQKLQTFSQLFTEIVKFLIEHYISKAIKEKNYTLDEQKIIVSDQQKKVNTFMLQIGKIALHGLMERNMIFREKDFPEPEVMEAGCRIGVLSQVKKSLTRRERRSNGDNGKHTVYFPHKLFQEFLASCYLASIFNSNREEYNKLLEKTIIPQMLEFRYVLYFTSSRERDVGLNIVKRVISAWPNKEFAIDLAFECQDPAAARMVAAGLLANKKELDIYSRMSPHTVSGYMFVLMSNMKLWQLVIWLNEYFLKNAIQPRY